MQSLICQNLGELFIFTGHLQEGQEYIEKSLNLGREEGEEFPLWYSIYLLGELWLARGQANLAIETLLNSYEKAKEYEDPSFAVIFRSLGAAHALLGEYNQAFFYLNKAILVEKENQVDSIALTLLRIAYTSCLAGKRIPSREYLKAFYKIQNKLSRQSLCGLALFIEGLLLRLRGKGEESLGYFSQAANILKKYSLKKPYIRVVLEMGFVYGEQGNQKKLQEILKKIKKEVATFPAEDIYARWGYLEALSEYLQGNIESAFEILNAHIAVSKEMQLMEIVWQHEFLLAKLYEANQQMDEAKLNYLAAMETLKKIWDPLDRDLKKDYLKDPRRKEVFEESAKFLGSEN